MLVFELPLFSLIMAPKYKNSGVDNLNMPKRTIKCPFLVKR